ncbi:hypothetical protein BGZ75_000921 [Mortierella antarctica]|nr:hypothetical protein BGZ75_000921 [Mortierella antarctica]
MSLPGLFSNADTTTTITTATTSPVVETIPSGLTVDRKTSSRHTSVTRNARDTLDCVATCATPSRLPPTILSATAPAESMAGEDTEAAHMGERSGTHPEDSGMDAAHAETQGGNVIGDSATPALAIDRDGVILQLQIKPKDLHTRKSPALPPLKTGTTSTADSASASGLETLPAAVTAAVTPSISTSPRDVPCISNADKDWMLSAASKSISNSLPQDSCTYGPNAEPDPVYPSPTPVSSPTDYFESQWTLPPIPSFTDIGLTFDKARTNGASGLPKQTEAVAGIDHRRSTVMGVLSTSRGPVFDKQIFTPEIHPLQHGGHGQSDHKSTAQVVPDIHPSVFDSVVSDDNEAYILWSTTRSAGSTAVPSAPIDATHSNHSQLQSQTLSSPEVSSSIVKRWSAGEAFKLREKGKRDSLDNDLHRSIEGISAEATSPKSRAARSGSDTPPGTSPPSSPTSSRPSDKLSSIASAMRSSGSAAASSSAKSVTTSANVAGSSTSHQPAAASEARVIMAATVEKLVEKLTSDIDYTFLTDFFLIFRLFISPLALFKLLMARFHWALTEDTPQRQIVRVRTFVTMRHWLLNYFEYDFMESKVLRRTFIENLRSLAEHPIVQSSVRDQRIVKELRRLFHLKRKVHCREMAQRALEQPPSSRQGDEPSHLPGRYRSYDRPADGEFHKTSKRSSLESGLTLDKRHQHMSTREYMDMDFEQRPRTEDERSSVDASTEQEPDLYSMESQSEVDIYPEDNDAGIHRAQDYDQELEDDDGDTDDFDSEVESVDGEQHPDGKGQLPSPAFSAVSSTSHGTARCLSTNIPEVMPAGCSKYLHSPEASDHSPYHSQNQHHHHHHPHHRSHTVPRSSDSRNHQRPQSYAAPSFDSSSSLALSPPESPRPLEPYMNPPPRPFTSSEKKKTWTQYMNATVEQLSKVKRAFLLKSSSSSIHDIHLAAASASNHSLVMGEPFNGRGPHKDNPQDFAASSNGNARDHSLQQWHEDRVHPGMSKLSRSMTMLDACEPPNSLMASSEGQRIPSKDRQRETESYGWSSDEDEDDDHWSDRARNQAAEPVISSVRSARSEHTKDMKTQHWRLEQPMVSSQLRLAGESGFIALDNGDQGSNGVTNDKELVTARELLDQDRVAMSWDPHPSGQSLLMPTPVSRPLRRTAPKRDHRASWTTMSSTNSSVYGAIISQGHVPPSQAFKERGDAGNVDRFVERLFTGQEQGVDADDRSTESCSQRTAMRRRSVDVIHSSHSRRSSMQVTMGNVPEGATEEEGARAATPRSSLKAPSPGMGTRRNHSLALHPHRQTMPIMHTHFHHHYLQHRQSLQEYPPYRRHSTDIQSLSGWENGKLEGRRVSAGTVITSSVQEPLLEGAAYAAALEETQRQLRILIGQENNPGSNSKDALKRTMSLKSPSSSHSQPHSLATMAASPNPVSEDTPLSSPTTQTRSTSDSHLLHLSESEISPPPDAKSVARSNSTAKIGAGAGLGAAHRFQSPLFYPSHGAAHFSHQGHENSYFQQRSPMNPRFQSIISHARDFPRQPPSIVLRYRSEMIAQQLCLIEREFLNQIPWYELVNAGWRKKPTEATADIATEEERDRQELDRSKDQDLLAMETILPLESRPSPSPEKRPWPLSRSQTARTITQRFPQQSQTTDSPKVTQLVDRFNLTCHWVTSEILKTTDLDLRVKVIEKFIRIAHTCFNHSNFSSLTQLMLGLQAHEVSRLNRTWARVRSQEMRVMQELVEYTSPFHNWKHLRNAMKNIADEWGGAAGGGGSGGAAALSNEATTSMPAASTPGGGTKQNQQQLTGSAVGTSLFSKMSISSSSKDKDKHGSPTMAHPRNHSHQHTSSFGKSSSHTAATTMSGHTKSLSGPVFPSLVSTLSKDKDKQRERQHSLQSSPYQAPQDTDKAQPQQHRGSIPFLGVYLSDLLYNTELPSYVEPRTLPREMNLDSRTDPLPSPPQSATSADPVPLSYLHRASSVQGQADMTMPTSSPWLVNLHKHRTIATIIKRILTFRTIATRYPFEKDPELYDLLMEMEALEPVEMERMSEMCEEKISSALASPVFAK